MRTAAVVLLAIVIVLAPGCKKDHVTPGWARAFGGERGDDGYSVQQTRDGGCIIAGGTESYGAGYYDIWLIKTNADGDTIWSKAYGGADHDYGESVQQTKDGGYIIVGFTYSFGAGRRDVWLVKTDANGDTVWTRTFGGIDWDDGNSVQQTQDGGYVITGYTESYGAGGFDVWLIKTDADGDTVWTRTFGGTNGDEGNAVQQTQDGGYIITGCTYSYGAGGQDVWLAKTDANGDTAWTRAFGGTDNDLCYSVQQTYDGGYVVAGYTCSSGAGGADVWLIKTDANGDTLWSKTFGGANDDAGHSVQQTRDGGYVIVGSTSSRGAGDADVWLLKTDANGDTVWTREFGGSHDDIGWSVRQTRDGGYVIAGSTESYGAGLSDIWLIKTDAEGRVDEGGGK
jgi:hypothetical protein